MDAGGRASQARGGHAGGAKKREANDVAGLELLLLSKSQQFEMLLDENRQLTLRAKMLDSLILSSELLLQYLVTCRGRACDERSPMAGALEALCALAAGSESSFLLELTTDRALRRAAGHASLQELVEEHCSCCARLCMLLQLVDAHGAGPSSAAAFSPRPSAHATGAAARDSRGVARPPAPPALQQIAGITSAFSKRLLMQLLHNPKPLMQLDGVNLESGQQEGGAVHSTVWVNVLDRIALAHHQVLQLQQVHASFQRCMAACRQAQAAALAAHASALECSGVGGSAPAQLHLARQLECSLRQLAVVHAVHASIVLQVLTAEQVAVMVVSSFPYYPFIPSLLAALQELPQRPQLQLQPLQLQRQLQRPGHAEDDVDMRE